MSRYFVSDREFKGYCFDGEYLGELKKWLAEQKSRGWAHADHVIVQSKPKVCGFRFNIRYFREVPFWPPHHRRGDTSLEIFKLSIYVAAETYDRWDNVAFDPLGQYQPGEKIDAIRRAAKKRTSLLRAVASVICGPDSHAKARYEAAAEVIAGTK